MGSFTKRCAKEWGSSHQQSAEWMMRCAAPAWLVQDSMMGQTIVLSPDNHTMPYNLTPRLLESHLGARLMVSSFQKAAIGLRIELECSRLHVP